MPKHHVSVEVRESHPRTSSSSSTSTDADRASGSSRTSSIERCDVQQDAKDVTQKVAKPTLKLIVEGCIHETVSKIVEGTYSSFSQNHGKVVFKKDVQFNSLDVLIYYWDDRDGSDLKGWWFAPSVDGEQVWAHSPHPSRFSNTTRT